MFDPMGVLKRLSCQPIGSCVPYTLAQVYHPSHSPTYLLHTSPISNTNINDGDGDGSSDDTDNPGNRLYYHVS